MQCVHLALFQLIKRFLLIDFCLLCGQPCLCGICGDFRSFPLQLCADRQLLHFHLGEFLGHLCPDTFLEELVIHGVLNLRLFEIAADRRLRRLLVHQFTIDLYL